jgi:hypothetical protein
MRALLILLVSLGFAAAARGADASSGHIVKVLSFFQDRQGRDSTSPSLFDRDAYQAYLREHTNEVTALRYDVLWNATPAPGEKIKITVELRGVGTNREPKLKALEAEVVPRKFRQWTAIPLAGEDFRNFGAVVAWRVRLWRGDQMLDQQQSFLW